MQSLNSFLKIVKLKNIQKNSKAKCPFSKVQKDLTQSKKHSLNNNNHSQKYMHGSKFWNKNFEIKIGLKTLTHFCIISLFPLMPNVKCVAAVLFLRRSRPQPQLTETFRLDKPFMYAIKDQNASSLFLGTLRQL